MALLLAAAAYRASCNPLSDRQLDDRSGDAWTLRQLAFHLADSAFYADAVGKLAP